MAISKQTRKLLDERLKMIRWFKHKHNPGEGIGEFPCEKCGFQRKHSLHDVSD